jgi:uncharacterized protein
MTTLTQSIIIAFAIIIWAYFLSMRPVTIKDATTHTTAWGVTMNSISVQGEWKVFADPDIFLLSIAVSSIWNTSAEAQSKTQSDIEQLRSIAQKAWIATKDIQTTQMSIYPEYEYLPSGTTKTKWYRATHGLTIKIRDLKQVDTLITQVTFSDAVQIQSMAYDIDDKTDLYTEARKLGFEKAKQKATELAWLASVSLDKPLSINDQVGYSNPYPPMPYQANVFRAEVAMDSSGGAGAINPWQLEVTVQVNIVYGVK